MGKEKIDGREKIRIFGHPWHLAHQYELTKLPWAEFFWLTTYKRGYNAMPRGDFFPKENWVASYEKGKYDLAILHLDQQFLEEGIWMEGKASLYRQLNEIITDIPKIVIIHGTPYEMDITDNPNDFVIHLKDIIGDNWMVFNSHRAKEEWCFGLNGDIVGVNPEKCFTIWHGLDPAEWWDLPKEPRVITTIGAAGLPTYYDRAFLSAVKEGLAYRDIKLGHVMVDWSAKNWDDYRNFIGRSLLYFNPTKESPMPRARTEAMLSGCCVITTPHHDADKIFKNGENGFIVKRNPESVVKLIEELLYDYERALKIGQAGKATAIKLLNKERYQADWKAVIEKVLNTKII